MYPGTCVQFKYCVIQLVAYPITIIFGFCFVKLNMYKQNRK